MFKFDNPDRRTFLGSAAASILSADILLATAAGSSPARGSGTRFASIKHADAGVLKIGYYEFGPAVGHPVLLLHGFPYSIDSFVEVAPMLSARGCRVIVPYLRGHGSTRFRDADTPRAGQQGALGVDVIALMDALGIDQAVLAGYDWGGEPPALPQPCGLVAARGWFRLTAI